MMLKSAWFIPLIAAAFSLLPSCIDSEPASSGERAAPVSGSEAGTAGAYTVLAEKLRAPWSIAFDEDAVLISERPGFIVTVKDQALVRKPVRLAKTLFNKGEAGFLGFVLSPDVSESRRAYAYHSYEEKGRVLNRVVLLEEKKDEWVEVQALLEQIPGRNIHNGGRLTIGPDRLLYITTGDAGEEELAQRKTSLAGKILRMAPDGNIPESNPFPGSYVYSYGHRNPQGIAWDSEGAMFGSEHGPSGRPGGHDELNSIEPGGNYGWPEIIGDERREGMAAPIFHTGDVAIAPSGIAADPENRLLVAALRGERLFRFDPANGKLEVLLEREGRLRDVKFHEGNIYVITNNTDGRGEPSEADDRLLMLR
ncbi:PQQ-dependent sugar dehydrogenase [Paenibacillus thermotolerans]|uniref:PQQ-dependent sugar dehydrogenase n=1 Tax=Paenibacillus thermotolerans TaxID=3027807 RepID=UPI0023687193|nr:MULTISPECIES: PQQ-dependent sugar dehydrogenase [unclassified Paenibacillus]